MVRESWRCSLSNLSPKSTSIEDGLGAEKCLLNIPWFSMWGNNFAFIAGMQFFIQEMKAIKEALYWWPYKGEVTSPCLLSRPRSGIVSHLVCLSCSNQNMFPSCSFLRKTSQTFSWVLYRNIFCIYGYFLYSLIHSTLSCFWCSSKY